MAFQRDFNELLSEILTTYKNNMDGDITQGSVLFIKAACTASMLWGLYHAIERASNQFFAATADREYLERMAAEYGIPTIDRASTEIADDVLSARQSKLAGGNRYDYEAWARAATLDEERITHARVVPLARGEGTFDIVVVGSENEQIASEEICAKIYDDIQERRPIGSGFSTGVRVCPASPQYIDVEVSVTGAQFDALGAREAIHNYLNNMGTGEKLRMAFLIAILYQYGGESIDIINPTSDVMPQDDVLAGVYHMLRAGNITITGEGE